MYMLVTCNCIGRTVNMEYQIGGVIWCSSGIIIGSCCYGGIWLGHVECVQSGKPSQSGAKIRTLGVLIP